jgi:hypothetical protein
LYTLDKACIVFDLFLEENGILVSLENEAKANRKDEMTDKTKPNAKGYSKTDLLTE